MTKAKGTKAEASAKAQKIAAGTIQSKLPFLGFAVWWTIHMGIELNGKQLLDLLTKTIGAQFMPPEPSKRRALRTALEAVEREGLIRQIRNDAGVIAYILAREETDRKNIDLDLVKENIIVFDTVKGTLDVRMAHKKDEIIKLFDKYRNLYTEDMIRKIALRYLNSVGAVTMRDTGGIYFVREQEAHDALKSYIQAAGCKFYSVPVPDVEAAKATMYEVIKTELERDLELAAEDVKEQTSKKDIRTDVLQTRIERFKLLRNKTEMYRDLLAADIEGLTSKLQGLSGEVLKALTGELESYKQAKDFPYQSRIQYSGKMKETYGELGVVVGYVSNDGGDNVKVLFDKTGKITTVTVKQVKLVN
jgi:hypothetical protein